MAVNDDAVSEDTILAGVVTLENQFTRLLANLMNSDPAFKRRVVQLLTGAVVGSAKQIKVGTQIPLIGKDGAPYGQPDMRIDLGGRVVLVEVKTSESCPFTPKEIPNCEDGRGYYDYLQNEQAGQVAYILPHSYSIPSDIEIKSGQVVRWNDIRKEIKSQNRLSSWFESLLAKNFLPAQLTNEDAVTLRKTTTDIGALLVLLEVTKELRDLARNEWNKPKKKKIVSEWSLSKNDCGFYIADIFWVGLYTPLWKQEFTRSGQKRGPLCFGVQKSQQRDRERFISALKGIGQKHFVQNQENDWLYGWIEAKDGLTAKEIWKTLRPVIVKTLGTSTLTPQS